MPFSRQSGIGPLAGCYSFNRVLMYSCLKGIPEPMRCKQQIHRMLVGVFRATVKTSIFAARHIWKMISWSQSRLNGCDGRTSFLISPKSPPALATRLGRCLAQLNGDVAAQRARQLVLLGMAWPGPGRQRFAGNHPGGLFVQGRDQGTANRPQQGVDFLVWHGGWPSWPADARRDAWPRSARRAPWRMKRACPYETACRAAQAHAPGRFRRASGHAGRRPAGCLSTRPR